MEQPTPEETGILWIQEAIKTSNYRPQIWRHRELAKDSNCHKIFFVKYVEKGEFLEIQNVYHKGLFENYKIDSILENEFIVYTLT